MTALGEIARLIRSKNAGPFVLTFDVMFGSDADFERVRDAGVLTAATFADLYGVEPGSVLYFECPNARAIKISCGFRRDRARRSDLKPPTIPK